MTTDHWSWWWVFSHVGFSPHITANEWLENHKWNSQVIKTTSAVVTTIGSGFLLPFSIFIIGENLHPNSWKSVGHLFKHSDANDYIPEEQGASWWHSTVTMKAQLLSSSLGSWTITG